ncbi:MAG: CaiB/BaiF CoA-transferase family protein [Pseudomonadota bacterium]
MTTNNSEDRSGPLSDLRVIEMGSLLAGPFCGQLLGDMGAEVIKIEAPNMGDPMRVWGQEKAGNGKSLWWPIVGRNKKAITVNCRVEEGQQIVRDLVAKSDFLLENFRPGTMERWGLGYDELSKINPKLIMIRVSGQGQTGPYAKRAGYGSIGEAMGGLRYVVGDPATPPSRMGISIGDSLAATFATVGALSALHHRERTGQGQIVDSAIYEAVLGMMESLVSEYQHAGYVRERTGSILPNVAPSNVYPTSDDKMILIAANQDTVFRRFAAAMGQPELADNPRYDSHHSRGENQTELDELIGEWTMTKTADELTALMEESGVPVGKIYRAPDMLEDPHFAAREAIIKLAHPEFGELAMQNVFPKLSLTPGEVRHAGPDLGQHNAEVFGEILGFSDDKQADLKAREII